MRRRWLRRGGGRRGVEFGLGAFFCGLVFSRWAFVNRFAPVLVRREDCRAPGRGGRARGEGAKRERVNERKAEESWATKLLGSLL